MSKLSYYFALVVEFALLIFCPSTSVQGLLQCACTTIDCHAEGASRCIASSMCYVQYLDRGDGASPWTRGCINGITNSLLCENQPPSSFSSPVVSSSSFSSSSRKSGLSKGGKAKKKSASVVTPLLWPLIHCCSTSFCNSQEFSASYPVWMKKKLRTNETSLIPKHDSAYSPPPLENSYDPTHFSSDAYDDDDEGEADGDDDSYYYYHPKVLTFSAAVNPIYIAVPTIGACILIIMVIFAFYLLRKHNHHGGPATPSLSSPFLYVDQLHVADCCESSSSYSHHHNHHHGPNPPPKYEDSFLSSSGDHPYHPHVPHIRSAQTQFVTSQTSGSESLDSRLPATSAPCRPPLQRDVVITVKDSTYTPYALMTMDKGSLIKSPLL